MNVPLGGRECDQGALSVAPCRALVGKAALSLGRRRRPARCSGVPRAPWPPWQLERFSSSKTPRTSWNFVRSLYGTPGTAFSPPGRSATPFACFAPATRSMRCSSIITWAMAPGPRFIHQSVNEGLFDPTMRPALIFTAYRYVELPPRSPSSTSRSAPRSWSARSRERRIGSLRHRKLRRCLVLRGDGRVARRRSRGSLAAQAPTFAVFVGVLIGIYSLLAVALMPLVPARARRSSRRFTSPCT